MSYAVVSILEKHYEENEQAPFVIFISMNGTSRFSQSETALGAILARIAYELESDRKKGPFHSFRKQYQDYDKVYNWILENDVILVIDELNVILPTAEDYEAMSFFLGGLVGRQGSALLYTTHHRIDSDVLRERACETAPYLSMRVHSWQAIPRFNSISCIRHMGRPESFWSAVLRGRIPALLVLPQEYIRNFLPRLNVKDSSTRQDMFDAILSGDIGKLDAGREIFRAYTYILNQDESPTHVWPPFLIAQPSVLGKNCRNLRAVLESPEVNQLKAFEALVQLAVVLQLLCTGKSHANVPRHSKVTRAQFLRCNRHL